MSAFYILFYLPVLFFASLASGASKFPVVNLGYARHAPTFTNTTFGHGLTYATYRNIRFAVPPTGELRFRAPITPPPASSSIQDGIAPQNSTNCIQTLPTWFKDIPGLNGTTWGSEDCLFLDVIVPEGLSLSKSSAGAPVLHWLYGGGFIFGAKDNGGDPASLLNAIENSEDKFIVVASNYRLGPFGWMSTEKEPSMTVNAGLYDAYAALNWTKQYISLFGGNPNNITVMGQSAGGGIIHHLLAADAEGKEVAFTQAILSSPGYRPHINRNKEMNDIYSIFLKASNCTNIECLRSLPENKMRELNAYMILEKATGPFGGPSIGYGPAIDNELVSDNSDRVLARASSSLFNNNTRKGKVKRIIAGGMRSDGIGYPASSKWKTIIEMFARTPTNSTIDAIEKLYGNATDLAPPYPDIKLPAQTVFDKFYGDIIYECHAYFAAKACSSSLSSSSCDSEGVAQVEAYRYDASAPPATHGDDMKYYFYSKLVAKVDPVVNATVAMAFQKYLKRFVLGQGMGDWPEYRSKGLLARSWMNITSSGFEKIVGKDEDLRAEGCERIVEMLGNNCDNW